MQGLLDGRGGAGFPVPDGLDDRPLGAGQFGQPQAAVDLAGKRLVVTAGGTQEPIDPVRIISNRSSGKMGCALAEAGRDRGAAVTLIYTPSLTVPPPAGVQLKKVETALQMKSAVEKACAGADASPACEGWSEHLVSGATGCIAIGG